MSLEASIDERIEELKKWQADQKTRLLKQQQEQRELLNIEQKRMYVALASSIDNVDVTLDSIADMSLSKIQEHFNSYPNTPDRSDNHDESSQYKLFPTDNSQYKSFPADQPALRSSTESSDESSGQSKSDYQADEPEKKFISHDDSNMSVEMNPLLSKRSSTGCVRIDDIPVPSPRKDFKTLLEEKLKDSDALGDTGEFKPNNSIKKKPFLRKGEGLARFRMNATKTPGEKISKSRVASLSSSSTRSKSPGVKESNRKSKDKIIKINKNSGISRRSCPIPKVAQQKLNLKNVALPRNRINSRSMSPLASRSSPAVPVPVPAPKPAVTPKSIAIQKAVDDNKRADESIGSDLDTSKLETKMFELLEEKAENSSFCSTSSAVIAFLQQSTPLKLKTIRKNLVTRRQAAQEQKSKIVDDELEALVHSLKSNKLDKPAVNNSKWDSGPFVNEHPIDNNVSGTPVVGKKNLPPDYCRQSNKNNYDLIEKLNESMTETDTESEKNLVYQKVDDRNMIDKISDANVMRVRFSEYNEYKMIGLTDTSTISRDSYPEEKNWTDNSSVESSDVEILSSRREIHQHYNPENDNRDFIYESTDDEGSVLNYSSTFDDKDNTITEIQGFVDDFNKLNERKTNSSRSELNPPEINDTIVRSELLKTRLRELEREIEIFRKENAGLQEERKKFDEEQRRWQKEFKEKEDNFKREQILAENNFQEEKRRLAREKTALENRLRDAREKSLQAKQERQEIQGLKDQLAELRDEIDDKENLWQTEQARQRSQIRVLQMENSKLKQEISKLQESKQSKLKKPSVVLHTKAVHNKPEPKKITFDDQVVAAEEQPELERETMRVKYSPDKISNPGHLISQQTAADNLFKKRQLYENLIKEAAGDYYEENIENIPVNIIKSPEKPKIMSPTYRKNKTIEDNLSAQSNLRENGISQSTQTSVELKLSDNNDSKRVTRFANDNIQVPRGSYQQFVREVINPKNQYSKAALAPEYPAEVDESRKTKMRDSEDRFNYPVDSSEKNGHEVTRRSLGEVNQQVQPTINYITDRRINQTKFVDGNESEMIPRAEQVPLPRPTDAMTPHSDHIQISHLSDLPCQERVCLSKQNIREVQCPDGHLEYLYPNGNVKKIYPDKNISKMIYYNGDVRETLPDGRVKYFYAATKTWQTTYPDGFEILEFPDGQKERRTKDGTIEVEFPDGSIRLMQPDGVNKWALPDGTIAETFPNGDKILSLPNGQCEIHTVDHKRREYPDGTIKYVYNDGTQETRYSNGRVRIKDKDGNLIMDAHQI
ncbi:centromere protein J [Microplitis mediator]|uniref:centromere protein J n=1 Tax=Microplitis mediator TaxID=375433 RepID=UPI00255566DF|nr:centromere protein J [Microplitis mediator]